jgi:hypothetical protein
MYKIGFLKSQNRQAFIILCVVTLLLFNGVLKGQLISNAKLLYYYPPWNQFYNPEKEPLNFVESDMVDSAGNRFAILNELRELRPAFWDHYSQLGTVGSPQIMNMFGSPFRTIPWLLFGPAWGWTIEIILKIVFGGFFLFLFLKKIGVRHGVALVSAISYIGGANTIAGEHQAEFSTVPLMAAGVLYFFERFLADRNGRNFAFFTLSCTVFGLSGFASIIVFFAALIVAYIAFRLVSISSIPRLRALIWILSAGILSLLLGCWIILPTAEFFMSGINLDYRESFGLHQHPTTNLILAFVGQFFGHPLTEHGAWTRGSYVNTGIFVGTLAAFSAVIFGPVAFFRRGNSFLNFFGFALVFYAFVVYSFPFENLERYLNMLPLFRGNPATYQKTVFQFVLLVFGSLSFNAFLESLGSNKKSVLWSSTCLAAWVVILATIYFLFREYISQQMPTSGFLPKYFLRSLLLALAEISGIAFLFYHATRTSAFREKFTDFSLVLLGVVAFGQGLLHSYKWISYCEPKYWYPPTDITDYLKTNIEEARMISLGSFGINSALMAYGLPVAAGRGPADKVYKDFLRLADPEIYTTHNTQSFFNEQQTTIDHPIWDLVNVKYIAMDPKLTPAVIPPGARLLNFKGGSLIERKTPGPIQFFRTAIFEKDINKHAGIYQKNNATGQSVLITEQPVSEGGAPSSATQLPPKINLINWSTDRYEAEIDFLEPGYLLLSTAYHSGWRLTINSKPVPSFRAFGFLNGAQIQETGKSVIVWEFFPRSLGVGLILSVLGAAFVLFFLFRPKQYALF